MSYFNRVSATQSGVWAVQVNDGTDVVDVLDLANNNPLAVAIVDGDGDQITSFGGGTQYTEGDTAPAITGTALLWEDTGDTLAAVSAATPLPVEIIGGSSSGTQYTEGDSDASVTGTAIMYKETDNSIHVVSPIEPLPVSVMAGSPHQYSEGEVESSIRGNAIFMEGAGDTIVPVQGTVADGVLVNLGSNNDVVVTGTVTAQDGGGSLTVDNSTLAVVGGGTEATALRVTIASDSTGVVSIDDNGGSVTVDGTITANAGTNLNTSALALESGGNLAGAATSLAVMDDWDESDRAKVNPIVGQAGVQGGSGAVSATTQRVVLATDVALPTGTNSIGAVTQATASNFNAQVVGNIAHDGIDSGNPIKIGGIARQANPTAVAALDRVDAMFDDVGRQVIVNGQVRDLMVHQHTQITNSTTETTILTAGAAGVFHDLVQIVITNQTATAVNVTIKDATAGTTRMIIALAASGGAVIPFARPVTQAAAAANWTATLSVNTVTVNFFVMAEKNV